MLYVTQHEALHLCEIVVTCVVWSVPLFLTFFAVHADRFGTPATTFTLPSAQEGRTVALSWQVISTNCCGSTLCVPAIKQRELAQRV